MPHIKQPSVKHSSNFNAPTVQNKKPKSPEFQYCSYASLATQRVGHLNLINFSGSPWNWRPTFDTFQLFLHHSIHAGMVVPHSIHAVMRVPHSVDAGMGVPHSYHAGKRVPHSIYASMGVPHSSNAGMGVLVNRNYSSMCESGQHLMEQATPIPPIVEQCYGCSPY
jgi:hypothetical protein